ncbi:hypothetical protein MAR_001300 [Mya arenaria]|uniref:Transposase n=1 Tax=Mya arenaria TaxID=6604 RepID=A0ABY7FBB2_MYAAR|nr:hypothetical protein MAR_001300 [Mya arenaria]
MNLIKSLWFTTSSPGYGQMVRDINKEKRVQFCNRLIQGDDDLASVIFTDESGISLEQRKSASIDRVRSNPSSRRRSNPRRSMASWRRRFSRTGFWRIGPFRSYREHTLRATGQRPQT